MKSAGKVVRCSKWLLKPLSWLFKPHSLQRSALFGTLFVIGTEVAVHELHHAGWFSEASEAAFDSMLNRHVGVIRRDMADGEMPAFAFIDANNETWRAWHDPPSFPKADLVRLIEYARAGGARAIVVDIDATAQALQQSRDGDRVAAYLHDYGLSPDGAAAPGSPPLILARPLALETASGTTVLAGPLRDMPASGQPVYWGGALFPVQSDHVVRRWRLWEATDCGVASPQAVPSIPLLVAAALQGSGEVRMVEDRLRRLAVDRCQGRPARATTVRLGRISVELGEPDGEDPTTGLSARIVYVLPWNEDPGVRLVVNGRRDDLMRHLSAMEVLAHDVAADPVRGRVVLIGASAPGAGDLHATPVGAMPGTYVLANAIATLSQYGQLSSPSLAWSLGTGVVLGLVVWAILEFVQFSAALVLCGTVVWFASFALSRFFLARGIWVDALIPTLGMFLHRWFKVLEMLAEHWKEQGWHVLLSASARRRLASRAKARPVAGQPAQPSADRGPSSAPKTLSTIVVLCLLSAVSPAAPRAQPLEVGGRIVGMAGEPADYRITRLSSTARVQVNYQVDLLVGDKVEALHPGKELQVQLAGERTPIVVAFGQAPLVVPPPAGKMSPLNTLARELFGWIGKQKPSLKQSTAQTLVRGPDINIPSLDHGSHYVLPGSRKLPVGWTGGTAPFSVAVHDSAGANQCMQAGVLQPRALLERCELPEGSYSIIVTDATGRRGLAAFRSVRGVQLPTMPTGTMAGMSGDESATAQAVYLASVENGLWILEAMIRSAELTDRYEPASILLEALLRGRRPD